MTVTLDLRDAVRSYVEGAVSLKELEERSAVLTLGMTKDDDEAVRLSAAILAFIAEHRDEANIREELATMLEREHVAS